MMRRLHRLAPWVLSVSLLAIGLTMGAAAAGGPSSPSIADAMATWIVGNAIALLGGLIAWTQLTLRSVRQRVEDAIAKHNGLEGAHYVAATHNHEPFFVTLRGLQQSLHEIHNKLNTLVSGQETTANELTEQDARLEHVEKGLAQLLTEHRILHGRQLHRRANDGTDFDPGDLRGVGDGV